MHGDGSGNFIATECRGGVGCGCGAGKNYRAISKEKVDLSLLETPVNLSSDKVSSSQPTESRLERHNRLISEGYVLDEMQIIETDAARNTRMTIGNYETRESTSFYTRPVVTETRHGNALDITSSIINSNVFTALGFLPQVGWIPSLVGITYNNVASFISRGSTTFKMVSTIRFYDVDVRKLGEPYYYEAVSTECRQITLTVTAVGYEADGTPFGNARVTDFVDSSPNYMNYLYLSQKAIECYSTGGLNGPSIYIERYPIRSTYYS